MFTIAHIYGQSNTERFQLIELPYSTNALEPVISKATMELHHGKHLQTYVKNLNQLINNTTFADASLEEIVQKSEGDIFNNAGQILNHNLYFIQFSPKGGGVPKGKLADAIKKKWGSFDNFKKEFVKTSISLFGSGWVWLAKDKSNNLFIGKYPNGSNPMKEGLTPLLGFDVWEHAYYLDYQNRRSEHLNALWNIIDWSVIETRF